MHLTSSGSFSRTEFYTYCLHIRRLNSELPQISKALILESAVCLSHTHKHMHVHINTFKYLYGVTFKESLLLLPRSSTSDFK